MEHFQSAHSRYVDKCVEAMMFYYMHVDGLDFIYGKRYYETVGSLFDWDNAKEHCLQEVKNIYQDITGWSGTMLSLIHI